MATGTSGRLEKASAKATGGRRSQRDRKSDVESAILDSAEKLLESVPLHELYVSDIISGAGISRATFYYYFASKYMVVAALLSRTSNDLFVAVQPWIEESEQAPLDRLRSSLKAAADVWAAHGAVTRSVCEHWTVEPEIRELWLAVLERFTDTFVDLVERDRKAGLAPAGQDAQALVASLVWACERVFYIASTGVDKRLPDMGVAVDVLFDMWSTAIYGAQPTPAKKPRRKKSAGA